LTSTESFPCNLRHLFFLLAPVFIDQIRFFSIDYFTAFSNIPQLLAQLGEEAGGGAGENYDPRDYYDGDQEIAEAPLLEGNKLKESLSQRNPQPNEKAMPVHRQAVKKRVDLTVAPEQQPCGVEVVEWVGLVASGFQFFSIQFVSRLAAVFAEEVSGDQSF
jgi:hypothetical protein